MSILRVFIKILLIFVTICLALIVNAYVLTYIPPYWCLVVFFLVCGVAAWLINKIVFRDEE